MTKGRHVSVLVTKNRVGSYPDRPVSSPPTYILPQPTVLNHNALDYTSMPNTPFDFFDDNEYEHGFCECFKDPISCLASYCCTWYTHLNNLCLIYF